MAGDVKIKSIDKKTLQLYVKDGVYEYTGLSSDDLQEFEDILEKGSGLAALKFLKSKGVKGVRVEDTHVTQNLGETGIQSKGMMSRRTAMGKVKSVSGKTRIEQDDELEAYYFCPECDYAITDEAELDSAIEEGVCPNCGAELDLEQFDYEESKKVVKTKKTRMATEQFGPSRISCDTAHCASNTAGKCQATKIQIGGQVCQTYKPRSLESVPPTQKVQDGDTVIIEGDTEGVITKVTGHYVVAAVEGETDPRVLWYNDKSWKSK